MRANVYAVQTHEGWRAGLTIAPEVDRLYWLSASELSGSYLRVEQLTAPLVDPTAFHGATDVAGMWFWRAQLPLGEAVRAVDQLGRLLEMKKADRHEALALMKRSMASVEWGGIEPRNGGEAEWNERGKGEWRAKDDDEQRDGADAEWDGRGKWESESELLLLEAWRSGRLLERARYAAALLEGRALLRSEAQALLEGAMGPEAAASWRHWLQLAMLLGRVRLRGSVAAVERRGAPWRRWRKQGSSSFCCLRCGEAQLVRTHCEACGRVCAYCASCIALGRSRECELLVLGQRVVGLAAAGSRGLPAAGRLERWGLSPAQAAAAERALRFVEAAPRNGSTAVGRELVQLSRGEAVRRMLNIPERLAARKTERQEPASFLLWAVTGAGKTEMVFPLLESVLLRGGRALLATPRRDVVLELDPRIRRAFPEAAVVTLYGGSEQRWERGDITLSTTHQLFRFHEAFDLVIVDELDAFPYVGDKYLHYASRKSCSPNAVRVLLSATPPPELQRDAKRGRLAHAKVPVRYHRHPLPVPKLLRTMPVAQMLQVQKIPSALMTAIDRSLKRGAQLFIFVQRIAQTEPMAALLSRLWGQYALEIAATSSKDPERTVKVQSFRSGALRMLVTTTILERGVTIPRSDVFILDADGRLFDEASLVQMAGRAGRSGDDPFGHVYFCSKERTRSQLAAVKQINMMNRIALRSGYLQ